MSENQQINLANQNHSDSNGNIEPTQPGSLQKERRTAVRSPLLFPVYNFGEALRIAEKVEISGGGKLEEHTLAIALSMSIKSSGFLLRALTARQFKLIQKNGVMLETTELAKSILKPLNEEERIHAMRDSFLAIPLFYAVATRFKGQPLPQSEVFKNILERELRIPHDRVYAAEKVLMDSARDAKVLTVSGANTYLAVDITPQPVSINPSDIREEKQFVVNEHESEQESKTNKPITNKDRKTPSSSGELLTISAIDLADLSPEEFDDVWAAIGKIVIKRGKRLLQQDSDS